MLTTFILGLLTILIPYFLFVCISYGIVTKFKQSPLDESIRHAILFHGPSQMLTICFLGGAALFVIGGIIMGLGSLVQFVLGIK